MKIELDAKMQVRLLCLTIEDGDVAGVQGLMALGCPTDHPESDKNPLLLALQSGNAVIADALMREFADGSACATRS